MKPFAILEGLPGADLIQLGLEDVSRGFRSPEACLVEMASPRLARAGILPAISRATDSETTLYRHLGEAYPGRDPYPIYNALCRRLVSFEQALDHRMRTARNNAS